MPVKVSWIFFLFLWSFNLLLHWCHNILLRGALYFKCTASSTALVVVFFGCCELNDLWCFFCFFFYWYLLRGKHPRNLFEKLGNFPFSAPPLPSPPLPICFTYGHISFLVTLSMHLTLSFLPCPPCPLVSVLYASVSIAALQ